MIYALIECFYQRRGGLNMGKHLNICRAKIPKFNPLSTDFHSFCPISTQNTQFSTHTHQPAFPLELTYNQDRIITKRRYDVRI